MLCVALNISGACNLNCRICSLPQWYEKRGQMPFETLKKIEKALPHLRVIDLSANCEPLLNTELEKFIKFIRKNNEDLFITLNTNGTLLNKKLSLKLLEGGLDRICVSLDSANKENFERIRRGACFDTVLKNIRELSRQRRHCKNRLKELGLITVIFKDNIYELEEILDLAKSLGINTWTINGLEPYSREMAGKILYGKKGNDKVQDIFFNLKRTAAKYGIEVYFPFLRIFNYTKCILRYCIINSDGEVYPCAFLSYKRIYYYLGNKLTHPKISFGNINNMDLLDIWNSEKFRKFRQNVSRGKFAYCCKHCLFSNRVICPTGI